MAPRHHTDAWTIVRTTFDPRHTGKTESVLAQGNGYVNVRNAEDESYVGQTRGAFVTLTFNRAMPDEVTELPNLPDVTALDLSVGGERFSLDRGSVEDYRLVFDVRTGETERSVRWTSPAGDVVDVRSRRFVSLANKHVVVSALEVVPVSGQVEVTLESGIDSRVSNSGSQHLFEGERRLVDGRVLRLSTRTCQSHVPVVVHCAHSFETEPASALPVMERRRVVMRYKDKLSPDRPLRMEKVACYHTGRDLSFVTADNPDGTSEKDPVIAAGESCVARLSGSTYEELLEASAVLWGRYWERADVTIESEEPFDQLGMRIALYHLNIMVDRGDSRAGIGAKGMTGEGYKGHSFWDTEIFLLPHYLLTDPPAARALLEYRHRSLPGAFAKASENGYEGAMFPWESAWLDDGETTPLYGGADIVTGESIPILTGALEHHITADIAWAVWLYYTATGDDAFMERAGCELMLEIARFWASRVEWKAERGRYEITNVIGPDEYKEHVDNNAFTNYLAEFALMQAASVLEQMGSRWPRAQRRLSERYNLHELAARFRERASALYLPQPNEEGLVPQNDTYLSLECVDLTKYRSESGVSSIYEDYGQEEMNKIMVSKQADLVMLLRVMPDLFDPGTRERNFRFYESRTLHDSSLSHAQHGILAAWMGLDGQALDLYRHAIRVDFGEDPASSDAGIHSANMGNIWQCVVFGFAGLRPESSGMLSLENHLPTSWKALSFEVVWRGTRLRVRLTHEGFEVRRLSGPALKILVDGNERLVGAEEGGGAA